MCENRKWEEEERVYIGERISSHGPRATCLFTCTMSFEYLHLHTQVSPFFHRSVSRRS
jgi:hypothetical protein